MWRRLLGALLLCVSAVGALASDAAPALAMTDRWNSDQGHGEVISDLRGRYVVLSMFYTGCRRICPQTVKVMQQAQLALRKHGIEPELVLVSYAAEQESPQTLADFRSRNALDAHWHLLAGSTEQTRDFAGRVGLEHYNALDEHYFHDFSIMLVEPDGGQHMLDWHHRDVDALVAEILAHR
jgi:protein SCO1/2